MKTEQIKKKKDQQELENRRGPGYYDEQKQFMPDKIYREHLVIATLTVYKAY